MLVAILIVLLVGSVLYNLIVTRQCSRERYIVSLLDSKLDYLQKKNAKLEAFWQLSICICSVEERDGQRIITQKSLDTFAELKEMLEGSKLSMRGIVPHHALWEDVKDFEDVCTAILDLMQGIEDDVPDDELVARLQYAKRTAVKKEYKYDFSEIEKEMQPASSATES